MKRIPNLRWWIAGLLAAATALNYLDRQSLPVVVGAMQKSIPISDQQFSHLQFMFLLAYGVMNAGGGKILDRLGTRIGLCGHDRVVVEIASMMQGSVHSIAGLAIARFMLGLGEGGGFPGSAKAVSEWFPAKEQIFRVRHFQYRFKRRSFDCTAADCGDCLVRKLEMGLLHYGRIGIGLGRCMACPL